MKFHSLIASDIDGTLIPEETTELPGAVLEQVRAAYEKGYLFVAASGRQYPSLRALFEPVVDQMAFLIENGTGIYYHDEMIYADAFDRELAIAMASYVQSLAECEFIADGVAESFAIPKSDAFVHQLLDVQKLDVRFVERFEEFPDQVMKVAVWCRDGAAKHDADFKAAFGDRAQIAVSAKNWIDFSKSNKGIGVSNVCRLFEIPEECTYAFGDNWNDVTMLDRVRHPYIMVSAQDALKQRYPNICQNVPEEMKNIFQEK